MLDLFWCGAFVRGVGLVYAVSLASLYTNILVLDKIHPTTVLLDRVSQDLPNRFSRFTKFPTFSWLNPSASFLQTQCVVGFIASCAIILGVCSPVAMFVSWSIFLSLATVLSEWLCFPWDCLQLEVGFLTIFMPSLELITNGISVTEEPVPFMNFVLKYLLFRVIFGMGKKKFGGPFWNHTDYLKWFLAWQPCPTPLAWYFYHLPMWVHKFNLVVMFIVEIPLPFFLLWPNSNLYMISVIFTILLQIGIALFGNYGAFNLLTAVLCIGNIQDNVFQVFPSEFSFGAYFITIILILHTFGTLFYLPWCSYTTLYWIHVPRIWTSFPYNYVPRFFLDFLKFLAPFRVIHAYGVFGYKSPKRKGTRTSLLIEGSEDGVTWHQYKPKYLPSDSETAPKMFAPYQPRIDHQLWYEGQNQQACLFNHNNPYYRKCSFFWFPRFLQLVLAQDPAALAVFREIPEQTPRFLRAVKCTCFYTEYSEKKKWFEYTERSVRDPVVVALPESHWQALKPEMFL
eukprot:TRINITY_DN8247_c0_g1_i1.p1 TRINITY_DN8247_c0_g1~~TRINITY_DN8247_c0_g1_i1.p1  ORF type:complete len:511 (+),score=56.33 TRINITY_DN8247_c0_g1_i1:90-1622(+)